MKRSWMYSATNGIQFISGTFKTKLKGKALYERVQDSIKDSELNVGLKIVILNLTKLD